MTIKYTASLNGKTVGNRVSNSDRVYTHAIVVDQSLKGWRADRGLHVIAWAGRSDLAAKEVAKWSKTFAFVTVVPAVVVAPKVKFAPSNEATAKAFNDSGVFAPFICIGKDKQ